MLFCNSIFEFIELDESLYFTCLDVEFHSGAKNKEDLIKINSKYFSEMTINEK